MLVICFTEFVGEKECYFLRWDNGMLITYGNITEKQQQCLMVMKKYPQNCESTSVGLAMDPTAHMSKHLNQLKFCLAKKGFYPMSISQLINLVSDCLKRDSQTVYNCIVDVETNCYQLIQTHINYFRFIIQRKSNCCSSRRYRHCSYDALSHHWREDMSGLIFYQASLNRGWTIQLAVPNLETIKDHLLLVHAVWLRHNLSSIWKRKKQIFDVTKETRYIATIVRYNEWRLGRSSGNWFGLNWSFCDDVW